jgi:hypothetical protein
MERQHADSSHSDGTTATIRSIDEIPSLKACAVRPIAYLREPELPEAAVVALTGDAGCGKSSIALSWTAEASKARPALILDRENPLAIIAERFSRLGIAETQALKVWGGWLPEEAPAPGCPLILDWVSRCDLKPIVLVDSMVAFLEGDENSSNDVRAFLHQARRLANLGAVVVVIHHDGKSDTARDFRGSSDFKAAIDQAYHVTNFGPDGRLGTIRLRCYKSRFGNTGDVVYHYRDGLFVRDEDRLAPVKTVTQQLTELLSINAGVTKAEFENMAAEKGLGRNRARDFANGPRVRREKGMKNRLYLWPAEVIEHDLEEEA